MQNSSQDRVLVVYPFFPHYRRGVMRAMAMDQEFDFRFLAGRTDPTGSIETMSFADPNFRERFEESHLMLVGKWQLQSGLVGCALRSNADHWILHPVPYNVSMWLLAALGKLLGKKVYYWEHGWIRPERGPKSIVRRVLHAFPNKILLYGHGAIPLALGAGIDAKKLHVIYNSLDHADQVPRRDSLSLEERETLRRKLFEFPERPLLVCTSRLTSTRGLEAAFRSLKQLADRGLPANLLLVGEGSERASLETLAKELNLDVRFHGPCYDEEELAQLIMVSDVTIAPGKVGLTAIHSLTYGVPVVTHSDPYEQMPESEAIIDGWNGATFKRGDVAGLSSAIERALELAQLGEVLHRRCYAVVDTFFTPERQLHEIKLALKGQIADNQEWDQFVSNAQGEVRCTHE